jgi:hypothetical protein
MERERYTRTEQVLTVWLSVILWLAGLFFAGAASVALAVELPNLVAGILDPFVVLGALAAIGIVGVIGGGAWKSVRPRGGIANTIYFELADLFGVETLECDGANSLSSCLRLVLKWRGRSFEKWSVQTADLEMIAWEGGILFLYLRTPESELEPPQESLWTINPEWSSKAVFLTADVSETEARALDIVELLRAQGVDFVAGRRPSVLVRRRAAQ